MREQWEMNWKDYYKTLQLDSTAEPEVIKGAFDRLARKYHPDVNNGSKALSRMKEINEAYHILCDPEKRRKYDLEYSTRYHKVDPTPTPPPSEPPRSSIRSKIVVNPPSLRFDKVEPGCVCTFYFTIDNERGAYSNLEFSSSNSWLKVVRWLPLSTCAKLPLRVDIEAIGNGWDQTYHGYITVKLDQEETKVKVELITNPSPGVSFIHYGQEATGGITKFDDYQDWKFKGHAGDKISIRVRKAGRNGVDGNLELYTPSGNSIAKSDTCGIPLPTGELYYTLTDPGIYSIHVTGAGASTGGYKLTLEVQHPLSIQHWQQVTGNIEKSDDYQDWNFIGRSGDIISIRTGRDKPEIDLLDPIGNKIATSTGKESLPRLTYMIESTGIFTIHAHGGYSFTGAYELTLECISVHYGEEVVGNILDWGENQEWNFTGKEGDNISIRFQQDHASFEPEMDLLNPEGRLVATSDGWGNSEHILTYNLKDTGIYTISVYGSTSHDIGAYVYSLNRR